MKCPHCEKEIGIRREFCQHCGGKVEVNYADMAAGYTAQVAGFKGREWEYNVRWLILAVGALMVVMYSLNDLWDKKLAFTAADVPSIEAPEVTAGDTDMILGAQRFKRPFPEMDQAMPKVFKYRKDPLKEQLREANGGTLETKRLVELGINFIQRKQNRDGSWDVSTADLRIDKAKDESPNFQWARVGITGLAVLAILGEGSGWKREEVGEKIPYQNSLKRALTFLVSSQDLQNGRFGSPEGNFMYNHGLATMAVAEAAGISGDPQLVKAAQKGVDLIERIQGRRGGWGYRDQILAREDSSVSAWQVQALLSAREAGLKVDDAKLKKALQFYQDATDPKTGVVAYDFKDNFVRPALYGVALMLRMKLGEASDEREIKVLAKNIMAAKPESRRGWGRGWKAGKEGVNDTDRARTFDPYRWYFSTYGLFFRGGEDWPEWNQALIAALKDLQNGDGGWRGNDIWSVKMGPVYSTSMCVMALQVYYRYH